jgi:hypothetical protein
MLAKQSTALTVIVGPILDSTGAEYASAVIGDLSISKNGGTLTAMASTATLTYIDNGMYTLVTTTGNMDTLGAVQVTCNKATYQMPKMERNVVPATVYDAIIANATNTTGGLPTATGTITALAGAVSTLTAGGVRTELATELGRIDATIGSRATPTNITQASGVTLTPTTGLGNQTANITGNLSGSVGSVTGAVGSVTSPVAVSDKTGFKLASDGLALVTAWTVGITGNLTGNVTGSVGSISGVTFPANFGNLDITVGGAIGELGPTALAANDLYSPIADAVWDEATSGHTTAGTTGKALIDSGAAGNPWATDLATGYSGTEAGNILNQVKSQTDLIQSGGTVYVTSPVTATGQLASPLIIGDDYLAANGRRFRWTVALPSGYVIGTSTARFGMRYEDDEGVNEFIATGTVTDATGGNVHLDFDVAKTVTGTLRPGWYQWSVEIVSATGTEITRVKSGKNVEWQEKQT